MYSTIAAVSYTHLIKRLHFALAGTLAFAIEPHGVALLNMGAVKQHNLHQLRRQPSGQNPAAAGFWPLG